MRRELQAIVRGMEAGVRSQDTYPGESAQGSMMASNHKGTRRPMEEYVFRSTGRLFLLGLILLVGCQREPTSSRTADGSPLPPSGIVSSSIPNTIDPNARYVIYIHGKIIEDEGVDAVSPQFGRYELTDILKYLAKSGFMTIGEVRSGSTEVDTYADHVAWQVESLLAAGVPGENITVAGFSKGGYITMLASSKLGRPDVRFVLIAICNEETIASSSISLAGRILSMYETSDDFGSSCGPLLDKSPDVVEFEEIKFETGKGHGTFYAVDPLWLDPMIRWINTGGS
jgi:hypothetical protein